MKLTNKMKCVLGLIFLITLSFLLFFSVHEYVNLREQEKSSLQTKLNTQEDSFKETSVEIVGEKKIEWSNPEAEAVQNDFSDLFTRFVYEKTSSRDGTHFDEVVKKMGKPLSIKKDDFQDKDGTVAIWGKGDFRVKIYFDAKKRCKTLVSYADYPKSHWSQCKWLLQIKNDIEKERKENLSYKKIKEKMKEKYTTTTLNRNDENSLLWINYKKKCAIKATFVDGKVDIVKTGKILN